MSETPSEIPPVNKLTGDIVVFVGAGVLALSALVAKMSPEILETLEKWRRALLDQLP